MIWHVLTSIAVGLAATAESCVYLTLRKRWCFLVAWAVVSALFFGYGFVNGLPAQVAYALAALAVGCLVECACYTESIEDRIYTAMLQYIVICIGAYIAQRYAETRIAFEQGATSEATANFTASPELFAIVVGINVLWLLGMGAAYRTIMRYTPYQTSIYRRCIALTAPIIPLLLFMAFGGDKLILSSSDPLLAFSIAMSCFLVVSMLLGLSSCVSANSKFAVASRLDLMTRQSESMLDHIKGVEEYNFRLRRFRHDQKHFIDTLIFLLGDSDVDGARKLLEELSERNNELASRQFCENGVINAMLTDAQTQCERAGIAFAAELHMVDVVEIRNEDLVALVKNMLDNAIECCKGLLEPENAVITIKIIAEKGLFSVVCKNTVDKPPVIRDNRIKTSRADSERMHGIGIDSMHLVAEKYGGEVLLGMEDGLFVASAHLDNVPTSS